MEHLQQVLWHEGMFLTPNHFQQWQRHAEADRRSLAAMLQPLLRGFFVLEIDTEALTNQSFALRKATGVFPDGTVFDMPTADPLPPSRSFSEAFDGRRERLAVLLSLPTVLPGVPLCDDPEHPSPSPVRFHKRAISVRDAVLGGSEREIQCLVKDIRVRFEGEDLDGHTLLKVAEIVRHGNGGYALAEDFIAPCLALSAAPIIVRMLRRLVDILSARGGELASQRRQRSQGMVEFSVSETANYSLLHTINGALPVLMHMLDQSHLHPERLYVELVRLAGMLLTYAKDGHARDFAPYRHDDLAASFITIDTKLRALLETNITARYVPLALTRGNGGIYTARLPEAVIDGHRLYLAVLSSAASDKIVTQTAQKAKIAAAARVGTLIAQALKGMQLTYLSVPPAEIPSQSGTSYFELQRSGDEWEQVVSTRSLGIFLPPDFTDLKMEFMAVKE
jgi:type VI secretion system protein ImpJ